MFSVDSWKTRLSLLIFNLFLLLSPSYSWKIRKHYEIFDYYQKDKEKKEVNINYLIEIAYAAKILYKP